METRMIFGTGQEKSASELGKTETWIFPKVVHLRLRDHSLLKFAPGARQVPVSLIDAERDVLRRNGASPVDSKQPNAEAESPSDAQEEVEGTQGQGEETEGLKSSPSSTQKVNKKK